MFTEEEKNEIIERVVDKDKRMKYHDSFCPFFDLMPTRGKGCVHCNHLFPSSAGQSECPCRCHNSKYVKDKFWKAME